MLWPQNELKMMIAINCFIYLFPKLDSTCLLIEGIDQLKFKYKPENFSCQVRHSRISFKYLYCIFCFVVCRNAWNLYKYILSLNESLPCLFAFRLVVCNYSSLEQVGSGKLPHLIQEKLHSGTHNNSIWVVYRKCWFLLLVVLGTVQNMVGCKFWQSQHRFQHGWRNSTFR